MINLDQWLLPTLALLPVLLGSFLAVGLPWARLILPPEDRADRVLWGAFGLALGAALWTAGMFLLGTFATITVAGTVALGAVIALAGVGAYVFARRRADDRPVVPTPLPRVPLAVWERLILGGLIVALILRVINVAYWPFTAYDPLWVYGYNARVFTLRGLIPAEIGYYPQLLPLVYTYAQQVWGGIDDHAARAAIPIFALGSILAAYLLGSKLFRRESDPVYGRRIGLLTAALWTFYPHHAEWSHVGDLEVPLTFFFTLAALFFILAWQSSTAARWRYAVMAGLMLGAGLWTKPTAGALVWGIGLVVGLALLVEVMRARREARPLDIAFLRGRLALAIVAGLAAVPIGGMWYVRNLLLGHPALVFPTGFWLTQAQRSGQELGWPLLILALLALYLILTPDKPRRADGRLLLAGLALMTGGALNSAGLWAGTPPHRITAIELLVIVAGAALYGWGLWRGRRDNTSLASAFSPSPFTERGPGGEVALILALIAPYWITWFWSYSYHPRLAFAIVPLQLVIVAGLGYAVAERLAAFVRPARRAGMAQVALLTLIVPGLWLAIAKSAPHLIAADLADDGAKQFETNPALFLTVEALRAEIAAAPDADAIHILAPGALRLPFFFPDRVVDTAPLTDLDALDGLVTHYVAGTESENVYRPIGPNPVRALPGQPWLSEPIARAVDDSFVYEVYRVDTARRHAIADCNGLFDPPAIYDDFAILHGYGMTNLDFWDGRRIVFFSCWEVTGDIDRDYTVFLHVLDAEGNLVATWDHQPGGGLYTTSLWQPGEFVKDELSVYLYNEDVPPGTYQVRIGLYDLATNTRVPVRVGDAVVDGVSLLNPIRMLAEPPE